MKKYVNVQSGFNVCISIAVIINIVLLFGAREYDFNFNGFTMWHLRYTSICLLILVILGTYVKKIWQMDCKVKYVKSVFGVLIAVVCGWLLYMGHSILYHNVQYMEIVVDENNVLVVKECEYIKDVLGVIYQKEGMLLKELKQAENNGEKYPAVYHAKSEFYPAKEGYFWVVPIEENQLLISYRPNKEVDKLYTMIVELQ